MPTFLLLTVFSSGCGASWVQYQRSTCGGMGIRRDTALVKGAHSTDEAMAFCLATSLRIDGVATRPRECSLESGQVKGRFDVLDGACPQQVVLDVPVKGQETKEWCWAASAQMTMASLGREVSQCQQAGDKIGDDCCGSTTCPAAGIPALCVQSGWPNFAAYGFKADITDHRALTWEELTAELSAGRPVPFSWSEAGQGHMMVARGVRTDDDGTRWVIIDDPEPACGGSSTSITYNDYVGNSDHAHWNDYFRIERLPPGNSPSRRPEAAPIVITRGALLVPPGRGSSTFRPTAVSAARQTVKGMTTSAWGQLGLPPPPTTGDVTYGAALPYALIWQRDLAKYVAGADPALLLKQTDLQFLPIGQRDVLSSGLMIQKQSSGFATVRVGAAALAKAMNGHLHSAPAGATELGLVRVPFLHAYFLVTRGVPELYFMLLTDDARIGLPAGEWFEASDVVARLAGLARTFVGGDLWR